MIQRYLELLNEEQLTRVIESPMQPGSYTRTPSEGPCLVGITGCNADAFRRLRINMIGYLVSDGVEDRYDDACHRFGTEAVNASIRLKAIAILAQRTAARTFEPEQEKALV